MRTVTLLVAINNRCFTTTPSLARSVPPGCICRLFETLYPLLSLVSLHHTSWPVQYGTIRCMPSGLLCFVLVPTRPRKSSSPPKAHHQLRRLANLLRTERLEIAPAQKLGRASGTDGTSRSRDCPMNQGRASHEEALTRTPP